MIESYDRPVPLLERDRELAVLRAALRGAQDGQGSALAVAGEAGVGKSALLSCAQAEEPGFRVLRGNCDPLSTPRPLGPFRDIAGPLGLGRVVRDEDVPLPEFCEGIYDALRSEPTVLIVEDLHWVDAASVDVLRFLGRRVEAAPLLVLLSYRDREVWARHPARPLLDDFARVEGLTTLHLGPLSVDAVRELVAGSDLDPEHVHRVTRGNPFFVVEVAREPDRPLPESVRDSILAHTSEVSDEDFEVLQLVAAAPDRLDDRVLPELAVSLPTLRRLDRTGLLTRSRGGLVFRHELARQAIESTIPPGGVAWLHARLLDALERVIPDEPAVLTHHAVAAGDRTRTAQHARAAADESMHAGAHTEAAEFLKIALDNLDGSQDERAELLQQMSFQQYMTSRLTEAIANVRATFPLWQRAGNSPGLAGAHEQCAVLEYYNAHYDEAESLAESACRISLEAGHEHVYAGARATRGILAYTRSDHATASRCSAEASQIAAAEGLTQVALRTQLVSDLLALASGDTAARSAVEAHIKAASSADWDELASTGYSHLVNLDIEHRRFRAADSILEESLPFALARDIPICHQWQTGMRSRLRFAQGRWSAAVEDAEQVLDEVGMPIARLWPLVVAGLVPLRRGEDQRADNPLELAWELSSRMDEPVRLLAVLSALAERVWMTGVDDPRVSDAAVTAVGRLAGAAGAEWAVGDLAAWLRRLDLLDSVPAGIAEPFRLALEGAHAEAAEFWHQAGEPFNEAMALADSTDPSHRVRAVELLDALGAAGTADRLRIQLRQEGVPNVPIRPRASTRANPGGLTNRQLDVAKLVAQGLTNAEIGTRLFISAKTADHHVSAVLTKLGVEKRRAVMMRAQELGLV